MNTNQDFNCYWWQERPPHPAPPAEWQQHADIAIIDLNKSWVVGKDRLGTDAGYSIYEGETMTTSVVHTLSRGRFVLRDGGLQEDAVGGGKYVARVLT